MTQTVLITGAASGIGLATLRRFAAEGWNVLAAVRSEARADELRATLAQDSLTASPIIFDQADRHATDAALERIVAAGVPDVLVNNASVGTFGPIELTSDHQIDLAMETNFVAPLRIARTLARHFRQRGSGVIINVTSGFGFAAEVGQGLYSATKHAVEGMSEALARELKPFGVRVIVIEPGSTQTDFNTKTIASEGYGPDSPYWDVISSRFERLGATIWKNGIAEPSLVGHAIFAAASDPTTPLFVPVGEDTILSARLRGRGELATYDQRLEAILDALS